MSQWPNQTRLTYPHSFGAGQYTMLQTPGRCGQKQVRFLRFPLTDSYPTDAGPGALNWPETAGGMSSAGSEPFIQLGGAASMVNAKTLAGDGTLVLDGLASLGLVISMTGDGTMVLAGAGGISLTLGLTGNGTLVLTGAGPLAVLITMTGDGRLDLAGVADLKQLQDLTGTWASYTDGSAENIARLVWERAIEAGYTAEELLRLLASVSAGSATGLNSSPVFKSLDGTKDRVTGTLAGETRTVTGIDPS